MLIEVVPCPAPSKSSSGGGFNLWSFMTAGVVAATVVGNIVDNVNDNNNNNNNNNNQDNQNSNNMNFNNNDNMNMNENMLNMAMGRGLLEEWVKEEEENKIKKEEARVTNKKDMEEKFVKKKMVGFVDSTEWVKETTTSSGWLSLIFQLVCKILTHWMEVSQKSCTLLLSYLVIKDNCFMKT